MMMPSKGAPPTCVAGVSVCFLQDEKTKTEMSVSSIPFLDVRAGNDFMMIKFSVENVV
jgi:hypothetical protein